MERLRMFTHFNAVLVSIKPSFHETINIFLSTRRILIKLSNVSESSIKIKNRLHETLFVILLTSAVICKQKLLRATSSKLQIL